MQRIDTSMNKASRQGLDFDRLAGFATFFVVICVIGLPLAYLFYGSFRSDAPGAPGAHFTLDNWRQVYGGAVYWSAFFNTLILSTVVGVLSVLLGAILAWIVARTNAPWRKQLGPLLVVPLMISNLVTALAWIALCAPNAGFINALTRKLFGFMLFDIYSFSGIVLILVLHYASFAFISIYAALSSIDSSLEEASYMLGGTPLRTAVKMTVPLIWPTLSATFLLIFIFAAENFSVPTILGASSGFEVTASIVYYNLSIIPGRPELAATAGTMLLAIAVVGTIWQRRIISRKNRYVTMAGKGGRSKTIDLGWKRHVATGFVIFYLFLSVILPYAALMAGSFMRFLTPNVTPSLLTLAHYRRLLAPENIGPIWNSMFLATAGALTATLLYVFLAYLIRRSPGFLSRFMDYAVIVPTVTPALVLGVGFMWAFIGLPIAIYGTFWILLIGYWTRYVGQGVRQAGAAFVQVAEELPEAARIAGASPIRSFTDILMPLLRPALVSLWTILFISIFMEISITIVLYSPNTMTLPVLLWSRMSGGFLTEAFAVAAIQATVIFVLLYVADRAFGTLRHTLNER